MGRLIDADNLQFNGRNYNKSQMKAILDFIDAQPTAYDQNKVVEQLEKKKQKHERLTEYEKKSGTITEEFQNRKAVEVLEKAIDIVKAGGVDGN